jgi:hypothetical protein
MNVIILTTGISGSSAITGFLARSGFWTGDETVFKNNITGTYETYENKRLVDLNDELFEASKTKFTHKIYYDANTRDLFNNIFSEIDTAKYKDFIEECNSHSPWVWKDPKLYLTIGFWKNLLDLSNTRVIVLHRNTYELWKSQAAKRIIYSYRYLKNAEQKSRHGLLQYLEMNNIPFISLEYDQFTRDPVKAQKRLSEFIETDLKIENWYEVYQQTSKLSGLIRTVLAYLIYIKNYGTRIK